MTPSDYGAWQTDEILMTLAEATITLTSIPYDHVPNVSESWASHSSSEY